MKVTISDVAKACGVSPVTVSRVIAGNTNVNAETKSRVLQTMRSMGYKSRSMEQRVSSSFSKSVGILLEDISDPTYQEIIKGIRHFVHQRNYLTVICESESDYWDYYITAMSNGVAGIIALSLLGDQASSLAKAAELKTPLVAIHHCAEWAYANSVASDDYHSAQIAVEYLAGLGHSNIAMINMPEGTAGAYEARTGYLKTMERHGLPVREDYLLEGDLKRWTGRMLGQKVMEENPEVTAMICSNESLAWGVIDAHVQAGKRVPEEMSVMTFDISRSQIPGRRLSAAGCYLDEISAVAAETLLDSIEAGGQTGGVTAVRKKIALQSHLLEGDTTAKPNR